VTNGEAVKVLSRQMASLHHTVGASFFRLEDGLNIMEAELGEGEVVVNITDETKVAKVPHRDVSARELRRILFEQRGRRWVSRNGAVLWTAWDEADKITYVGFAAVVPQQVGLRLVRRNPGLTIIRSQGAMEWDW